MSAGIKANNDGSAAIQVGGSDYINIASSGDVTIPQDLAVTGTLTVSGLQVGAGPAFSVYRNAARNITGIGWTAVLPDTEEFDTASCYDTTTGRFTPTVAGYYQINASVYSGASTAEMIAAIYKNGTVYKYGARSASGANGANVASMVYFNGTTDYVEFYVYYSAAATIALNVGSTIYCYMNGALIRPA